MAEFVNPYNFVRSEYDAHKTSRPLGHERIHLEGYSGRIECSLSTITPTTTKSFDQRDDDGKVRPISERGIFGSSLKGMIRSTAEAIANACYPQGGISCHDETRLCICCRMFGWLRKKGGVHLGRVYIHDASPTTSNSYEAQPLFIEDQALSGPRGTKHRPFYYSGENQRGRKFYYHHDPRSQVQKVSTTKHHDRDSPVTVAKADQTFSFRVDFTDLTGAELGLLCYALQLEEGLFHKFGKGKPLGFGTVKTAIETLFLLPRVRYENWESRLTPVEALQIEQLESDSTSHAPKNLDDWNQLSPQEKLAGFLNARFEDFFQTQFGKAFSQRFDNDLPHMLDLKHLLSQHNDYPIHYPTKEWFDDHSNKELPTALEVQGDPPGDRSKWLKK